MADTQQAPLYIHCQCMHKAGCAHCYLIVDLEVLLYVHIYFEVFNASLTACHMSTWLHHKSGMTCAHVDALANLLYRNLLM